MAEEKIGIILEATLRQMEQVIKGLDGLGKKLDELEKKAGAYAKAQASAAEEEKKAAEGQTRHQKILDQLAKRQEQHVQNLMKMGKTEAQAVAETKRLTDAFGDVEKDSTAAAQALGYFEGMGRVMNVRLRQMAGGLAETIQWWKRVIVFWAVAAPPLRIVFALVDKVTESLSRMVGVPLKALREVGKIATDIIPDLELLAQTHARVAEEVLRQNEAMSDQFRLAPEIAEVTRKNVIAQEELALRYAATTDLLENLLKDIYKPLAEEREKAAEQILEEAGSAEELRARLVELYHIREEDIEGLERSTDVHQRAIAALWNMSEAEFQAIQASKDRLRAMEEAEEAAKRYMDTVQKMAKLGADLAEGFRETSAKMVKVHQDMADRIAEMTADHAIQMERLWQDHQGRLEQLASQHAVTMERMAEDYQRRIEEMAAEHQIRMQRMEEDHQLRMQEIIADMERRLAEEHKDFLDKMEDLERDHRDRLRDINKDFQEDMRKIEKKYREEERDLNKSYQAKRRWLEVFGRKDLLQDLKKWKEEEKKEIEKRRKEEEREARRERREARKEEQREYKRRVRLLKQEHKERMQAIREEAQRRLELEQKNYELRRKREEEDFARRLAMEEKQYEERRRRQEEDYAQRAEEEKKQYEERKAREEEDFARREQAEKDRAAEQLTALQETLKGLMIETQTHFKELLTGLMGSHKERLEEEKKWGDKSRIYLETYGRRGAEGYAKEMDREFDKMTKSGGVLDNAEKDIVSWSKDQETILKTGGKAGGDAYISGLKTGFANLPDKLAVTTTAFKDWLGDAEGTKGVTKLFKQAGIDASDLLIDEVEKGIKQLTHLTITYTIEVKRTPPMAAELGMWRVPMEMPVRVHPEEAILPVPEARAYRSIVSLLGPLGRLTQAPASRYYYEGATQIGPISIEREVDLMKLLAVVDRKLGSRASRRMRFGR